MKRKLAEILNVIFGFRKTLVFCLVFLLAIVFRVKGYIDGQQLTELLKDCTMSFFAVNGVEHVTTAVNNYVGVKTTVEGPADVDESNDKEDVR